MWGLILYKTGKNTKVLSIKLYKLCRVAGQLVNTLKPCKMYEIYIYICLLYTSPSPRDRQKSRMPSSA